MKPQLILVFIFVMLWIPALSQRHRTKRIVGESRDARQGEIPFALGVELAGMQEKGVKCSFNLITDRTAIGCAHCMHDIIIYGYPLSEIIIWGGNIERRAGEIFPILKVIIHEHFVPSVIHNDISLVILKNSIRNKFRIKPVALPAENRVFEGMKGKVAGWGMTDISLPQHQTAILKVIEVKVVSQEICSNLFPFVIIEKSLCASSPRANTGPGDTGAPLIISDGGKDVMIGMELAGSAWIGFPSLYIAVNKYLDWIQQYAVGNITIV